MKKINKRRFAEIFVLGIVILLLFPIVSAGISMPYTKDLPMYIGPGESKDLDITIQSSIKSVMMNVKLVNGDVVSLLEGDKTYTVEKGSMVPVKIRVSIPDDAPEGKEYLATFLFSDVTPSENQGSVTMSMVTEISMKIIVKTPVEITPLPLPVAQPEKGFSYWWLVMIVAIVLAIALIAYYLLKPSNKKRR